MSKAKYVFLRLANCELQFRSRALKGCIYAIHWQLEWRKFHDEVMCRFNRVGEANPEWATLSITKSDEIIPYVPARILAQLLAMSIEHSHGD